MKLRQLDGVAVPEAEKRHDSLAAERNLLTLDGRGMLLAGMPNMEAGQDVLLFLSEGGSTGVRMPVGLAQGEFTVYRLGDGTKSLVPLGLDAPTVDLSGPMSLIEKGEMPDWNTVEGANRLLTQLKLDIKAFCNLVFVS